MIVNFVYASGPQWTGGVVVLYELANGLARRGHEVRFLHGPATPYRVDRLEDLPDFPFEPSIQHRLFDDLDDPSLPTADVAMAHGLPPRLGLPVAVIQGYRMMSPAWEHDAFRQPVPKICVARWLVDVGIGLGVPAEQLLHVPCGLDHERFALRTPIAERDEDVAVLRNPHREKRWGVALGALEELVAARPVRGVVFGMTEPPRPLPAGIRFVHRPSHEVLVDDVYGRAKVFLQSSSTEGFGLTPVEAMACGCALVTTDNGGSRDYAIHDETALVVPPDDPVALGRAALELLEDDERRIRLATAGERYVRRFDWDRSAELLEGHLQCYVADPARFQAPPADVPDLEHHR